MLTVVPLGLGSNPREDMDVCKCIVLSRHGGTLNSRRAANPLVSHGSIVVKIMNSRQAFHEMEPSASKDPTCREVHYTLKYFEAQSPVIDVVRKLEESVPPAQVKYSSLDHGL
ncbi:hypothetical protein TNCV_4950801 [Trichonephila clavipes]|nr:hypothetical protein TNCV_4950801 [Trichonephila clavipes]